MSTPTPLRVLILQDSPSDAERMLQELRAAGFAPVATRVGTEECYLAHLSPAVDLILADYRQPQLGALQALRCLRESGLDIPMIVVTGAVSEEAAVECMKQGAADYLLKDRLARLGPAVAQALEQKRLRDERRQAEERMRLLAAAVQAAVNGVLITDREHTILWLNPAFSELTGKDPAEILGKHASCLGTGEVPSAVLRGIVRTLDAGRVWRGELRSRSKDGREHVVDNIITPVRDAAGVLTHHIGIWQDITEHKRAEEARDRLAAILEASPDLVGSATADGRTLSLNRAGCRMLGIGDTEDVSGVSIADLHPRWAAETVLQQGLPAAERDGVWSGETALLSRSGEEVPIWQVLLAHRGADGAVQFYSTIARDLTERKRMEEQLLQAQKMEAVGRLAGGVAHDFNNMLMPILTYSSLVLDAVGAQDPVRGHLEELEKAVERAASLPRQLLTFSRKQVIQPKVLDLNAVITGIERMLHRLIGEDITLVTCSHPGLGKVKADPGYVEQVLMNLAVNARDAMPEGGHLTIEAANYRLEPGQYARHAGIAPGAYVTLTVSDTGCGMDQETQARIFEPFFTTKPVGQGTGLGLATVYAIVQQSDGEIRVDSAPGVGATFTVYLPRVDDALLEPGEGEIARPMPRGAEAILLVEDEDAVRAAVREILEVLDYRVLDAAGGEEALAVSRQHSGPIHLLLTDVVMPGMSGRHLAERLALERPDTRVLFMSGHTDDAVLRHGVLAEGVAFVQKPFPPGTLARKLREVLDA